ncbi:DUF1360 domain-containing protein [Bacillus sp. FJAT-49705]|uniref:DUF1360 domain-containing protein n=1 Tax=Cytobacillus citreus TaxID=2833586 RepID=A0ABS5NM59_9BACI|nr:DUF1360 domain-containing protein [Cytobacillus citreus]MBS4188905.1 DUF1360 domain-containing protein [Cytobacillus citreus]
MDLSFMELMILALASFRLTRLMVYDKITEFIRRPFFDEREEKNEVGDMEVYIIPKDRGIRRFFGELLSCYWCTGVWTSVILYFLYFFFYTIAVPIMIVLAVAGLAAIIETIVQKLLNE